MRVADIRLLFQASAAQAAPDASLEDNDDGFSSLSPAEQAARTASLQPVLLAAQQLWVSGLPDLDAVAEILGDASRDVSWRIPIGESGLLDFFLGILSVAGLRQSLTIHTLRLIGNSCADEDENRARIVNGNHLPNIISLLRDDSALAFVIPVLYNICVDYEPAQLQASQAYLSRALISIVSSPRLGHCRAFLNIICKILGLLVSQDCEASQAHPATPVYLLALATHPDNLLDIEEFLVLITVSLSYLTYEPFQEELIRQGAVQAVLTAYSSTYSKYDATQIEPEEAEELKLVRNRFTHIIADISALPSFALACPLASPVVKILVSWITNRHINANIKATACFALGNLARSDESSISFVHDLQIHTALISLLSKHQPTNVHSRSLSGDSDEVPPPSQLLYAALSFLKNLAIPAANKPVLGVLLDRGTNVFPRLWNSTDTQPLVQFAAISLTRLLLVSCPENVRRICLPLSPDPSSPAHDRSNVHVLSAFFSRIDAENTKTEAARAIATICRVLHSAPDGVQILSDDWEPTDDPANLVDGMPPLPPPLDPTQELGIRIVENTDAAVSTAIANVPHVPANSRRANFYALHWDISDALTYLVTQSKFPVLRSEVWFISALMGRSPDGARLIMRALHPFDACRALVEAVCGHDMFDGHEIIADFPGMIDVVAATGGGQGVGKRPTPQALSSIPRRSLDEISVDTLPATNSMLSPASGGSNSISPASTSDLPTAGSSTLSPSTTVGIEGLGLEPQQVDSPRQANIARVDRENGLVLIAEILKNYGEFLPFLRRVMFEQILQTGGEMVIHARAIGLEE